ncbi:MAG: hypothetical protein LBN37_03580, partial [Bacteroidales bacterium]|nr:hypothetical protein [Bacteroidales bacterium]
MNIVRNFKIIFFRFLTVFILVNYHYPPQIFRKYFINIFAVLKIVCTFAPAFERRDFSGAGSLKRRYQVFRRILAEASS